MKKSFMKKIKKNAIITNKKFYNFFLHTCKNGE